MKEADIYEYLFAKLDTILTTYITDTATAVIGSLSGTATILLILYVMLWGWSMLRGVIDQPLNDAMARFTKMIIVTTFALNIGYYSGWIVDFVFQTPDTLAAIISGGGTTTSAGQYLDQYLGNIYQLHMQYLKQ